jgi:hypothetical protein
MNLEFREIQKFRKGWHFFIAGFPVVLVFILFLLVQLDFIQTKNQQKNPFVFLHVDMPCCNPSYNCTDRPCTDRFSTHNGNLFRVRTR